MINTSHRNKPREYGTEPNDLCPCYSGLKYKKCCGSKRRRTKGGKSMSMVINNAPTIVISPHNHSPGASQAILALARKSMDDVRRHNEQIREERKYQLKQEI